ncbi:thiol reductant ABC exporter subunit CydC [Phaeovibrio sulfidiphilus]|uniref:Thiol reductant ABC exporter subunit CydC n=1 Tax=Phaeovibrio sulfidiphilus TaxID=1220600 RepID=A0A8J6YKS0_9PROT|nr:thiol reductant ABC exporter subunit CydC [Phaeovibrio sulfidiphilus]MBE1236430.1 thiol reductant ABC exporter subunit CydC [Phaeovibrio sulfidiphilus]
MTFRRTRFLLNLLSGHWLWSLVGVFFAIVCAFGNIALLVISGWFLTGMAAAGLSAGTFNYLVPAAIIRACSILRSGGRYLDRLFTHDASLRVVATLRPRLFRAFSRRPGLVRMLTDDPAAFHSAALAGQLGADLDTLQRFYLQIAVPAIVALVLGGGCVLLGFSYGAGAGVVLLAALVLGGAGLPGLLAWLGRAPGQASMAERTVLRTLMVDALGGRDELVAFGALGRHEARLEASNLRLAALRRRLAFQDSLGAAFLPVLSTAAMWAMLLILVPRVSEGTLGPLSLALLVFLALALFEVLTPLPEAFQKTGATTVVLDRVLDLSPELEGARGDHPAVTGLPAPPGARAFPAVRLEAVTVGGSGPGTRAALGPVTLDLTGTRRIGLVGASGAGKSTLAMVFAGVVPLDGGRVFVDGVELPSTADARFQGLVSLAPQTPAFLSDTIRRNLQIARADASEAECQEALETACLADWVNALPEGLDTLIGEGGRPLSGGEARRLSIARALLGRGPLLVLDEPGEGLDPALEAEVLSRVLAASAARPVVLVTHRPAGLEAMDEVLVLDEGRIVERGDPWALATARGPFQTFLECAAV